MSNDVPIASLQPFESTIVGQTIKAEISLVWPYSSSHESAALLLVDTDFRKRYDRGQVRVVFHGPAAKALAKARLGIGDVLRIDLAKAAWRNRDERAATLTPGKAVEAELLFERSLKATVLEDASGAVDGRVIEVEHLTPQDSPRRRQQREPVTPRQRNGVAGALGLRTPFGGGYASPAFMKRLRLSQEHFLDSPGLSNSQESFGNDSASKRRRISYKNVTEWRFAGGSPTRDIRSAPEGDEEELLTLGNTTQRIPTSPNRDTRVESLKPDLTTTPSPRTSGHGVELSFPHGQKAQAPIAIPSDSESHNESEDDNDDDSEGSIAQGHTQSRSHRGIQMAPPPLPRLQMPSTTILSRQEETKEPSTPELRPVSGVNLPLPSPFPQTPLDPSPTKSGIGFTEGLPIHDRADTNPIIEHSGYFDRSMNDSQHTLREDSSKTSVNVSETVPLADAINDAELIQGHIEGHASPSEGSEADVSSEEDDDTARIPTSQRVEDSEDGKASPESPPISDNTRNTTTVPAIPDQGIDIIDSDRYPLDDSVDVLSGISEPSDDEEHGLEETRLAGSIVDPDDATIDLTEFGTINLSEGQEADQYAEETGTSVLDRHPFGLDGSSLSHLSRRTSLPRRSRGVVEDAESVANGHLSQDEDAAFAALDEALHTSTGRLIQEDQMPMAPLSSNIAPGRAQSIEPPVLHEMPIDEPVGPDSAEHGSPEASKVVSGEQVIKSRSIEQTIAPESEWPDDRKAGSVPDNTPPDHRLSLKELKKRIMQRAAKAEEDAATRKPVRLRSPSIEVVDLTEADNGLERVRHKSTEAAPKPSHPGPGPRDRASYSPVQTALDLLQIPARPESVPDSVESPVTTLAPDSSPLRRGMHEDVEYPRLVLADDDHSIQPSQELGGTQYKAPRVVSRPLTQLSRIAEDDDKQDADEEDFDEKLLAELEADRTAEDELVKAHVTKHSESATSTFPEPRLDNITKASEQIMETPVPKKELRVSRRPSSRLSLNTEALATWFSPKNPISTSRRRTTSDFHTTDGHDDASKVPSSTAPAGSTTSGAQKRERQKAQVRKKYRSISPPQLKRYAQSQGLATRLSYFTPLTNLDLHLGSSKGTVDILVIASSDSAEVKRARSGPRDWFTFFHVTDPEHHEQENKMRKNDSFVSANDGIAGDPIMEKPNGNDHSRGKGKGKGKAMINGDDLHTNAHDQSASTSPSNPREDILIEVFRPWKASLPSVSSGDVVLLRSFHVKSRDRRSYLLSGEESAWCVFRFGEDGEQGGKTPAWAKKSGPREEIRGPPLDIGDEERERAKELRGWWEMVEKVGS
ncbi:hypothetical protein BDZ85DRAFT_284428 [Elsinoe ampelina]|uniref:Telomeric single stranded DNA binding POT1/Cdc13 domain-containing protein n=1 Tax=Elsinoe ampelina TaxID=302913 RepID=A0A6A6G4L3_9PEZI|nr:hypothetical protein BDZ85DRAFT_284428 [Elsinoe ampelina]